jgi:hypothetical protein
MLVIIKMDKELEIKKLIEITTNDQIKKQLEMMLVNIERLNKVLTCDVCGSKFKYHSKAKHLKTRRHIETVKNGVLYKAKTTDFCKKSSEIDEETLMKKRAYYKERYQIMKQRRKLTKDTCEKTT